MSSLPGEQVLYRKFEVWLKIWSKSGSCDRRWSIQTLSQSFEAESLDQVSQWSQGAGKAMSLDSRPEMRKKIEQEF